MYSGCNLLRVDFSKLSELSVRYNNDKTRDFTNALLPSSDAVQPAAVPATAPLDDPQRAAATHPGTGCVAICDFVLTSIVLLVCVFSTLTLLIGRQKEHPACKT